MTTSTAASRYPFAPVALFAYKRPTHLACAIDALRANPEASNTLLYVFCDGAKDRGDAATVAEVRGLVDDIEGFSEVRVIASDFNQGLATSIISGVGRVLKEHERVIVLEDDLVVAPFF